MNVYYSLSELKAQLAEDSTLIATIGLFDGVHRGHQYLIERCRHKAKALSAQSLVITMDRHPLSVLCPEKPLPPTLASLEQKIKWISETGADHLLVLPFSKEVSKLSVSRFLEPLIAVGLKGLVLGYDNRFGSKEDAGATLADFDARITTLGISLERVEPFLYHDEIISSSRIRRAITKLMFDEAEAMLGRPYTLIGMVQEGRRIGRSIGFPTANIVPYDPNVKLPEEGVYIADVCYGEKVYPSMAYYGSTPTITPNAVPIYRVEAYLFGFKGDLYGKELEIGFRQFLRSDKQFSSLEELQEQLSRDAETTLKFYETHSFSLL